MFFILSKVVGYLLNPLVWILVLLVIGLFLKNHRKKKRLFISAAVLLWFFSNSFICDEFVRRWERPIQPFPDKKYDVGIVLTGDIATFDNTKQRIIFRSGSDRILQAISLYNQGIIDKILISGSSGSLINREIRESAYVGHYLETIGIVKDDILIEAQSRNTIENAKFSITIVNSEYVNPKVLLITSSLQMQRAESCFTKNGLQVDTFTTSKISGERVINFERLIIPNINALREWKLLLHEVIGFLTYKIFGFC